MQIKLHFQQKSMTMPFIIKRNRLEIQTPDLSRLAQPHMLATIPNQGTNMASILKYGHTQVTITT